MQMLGNNNNNRFSTMQPSHIMITCSEMKVNTCCAVSDSEVAAFESGSPAEMLKGGGRQNTSNNDAAGERENMHFVFHPITADKCTTAAATKKHHLNYRRRVIRNCSSFLCTQAALS